MVEFILFLGHVADGKTIDLPFNGCLNGRRYIHHNGIGCSQISVAIVINNGEIKYSRGCSVNRHVQWGVINPWRPINPSIDLIVSIVRKNRIITRVIVTATDRTGVEMEALTGASVAALTIYDMCKAIDETLIIEEVRLLEKTGGTKGR